MTSTVFIDGEAGTTGLQIRDRLAGRSDIRLVSLPAGERKVVEARREALNSADLVILCLPDEAAREAVAMIETPRVRVIDASSAHRVADGWTYGFPEAGLRGEIRSAARVSNPGCYATGFVALVRPLVQAGLVPADWPLSVHAVSGYSGGGRAMIEEFEGGSARFRAYALELRHKHLPEMQVRAGLSHPPTFSPSVGPWRQGMIVEVPLPLWALRARPSLADMREALARAYAGERFIEVAPASDPATHLEAEALNGSNRLRLYVTGNGEQARLLALLDNLGKGAAGAAAQNVNLMLGLEEATGLE